MKIYLAKTDYIDEEGSYNELMGKLGTKEVQRIERFKRPGPRKIALLRQIILQQALYETFGECRICLKENDYGKPYVEKIGYEDGAEKEMSEYSGFDFNISHSETLVAVVFGNGRAGIDVESISRVKDYDKLTRFFYDAERKRVSAASDPQDEFCRIWTFREAFSKEEGVGLSLFSDEEITIDYDNNKAQRAGRSCIFYEYPFPDYHITCCVEESVKKPELICIEEGRFYEICRASEFAKIHISVI